MLYLWMIQLFDIVMSHTKYGLQVNTYTIYTDK